MRKLALALVLALLLTPQTQAIEIDPMQAAEGRALCIWPERSERERGGNECASVTLVLDVAPGRLHLRETSLVPLADFYGDYSAAEFLRNLTIVEAYGEVWRDLDTLNADRRPYLKFVTQRTVTSPQGRAHYCASADEMYAAGSTQVYLSSEPNVATDADLALPPDLNRRFLDAIRVVVTDRTFQGELRKRGMADTVVEINAVLAGLCGAYLGPSFGGDGVDRWESFTRDGARQPSFDTQVGAADSAQHMRIAP